MKPWHDDIFDTDLSDSDYENLWKDLKAEEFYFNIDQLEDCVVITPKEYFDLQGFQFDQHLIIDYLLPENLEQDTEGCYLNDSDLSNEQLKNELIARGFIFNEQLIA